MGVAEPRVTHRLASSALAADGRHIALRFVLVASLAIQLAGRAEEHTTRYSSFIAKLAG